MLVIVLKKKKKKNWAQTSLKLSSPGSFGTELTRKWLDSAIISFYYFKVISCKVWHSLAKTNVSITVNIYTIQSLFNFSVHRTLTVPEFLHDTRNNKISVLWKKIINETCIFNSQTVYEKVICTYKLSYKRIIVIDCVGEPVDYVKNNVITNNHIKKCTSTFLWRLL